MSLFGALYGALSRGSGSDGEEGTPPPTGSPEIAVSGNGVNIADGDATPSLTDHTDFGEATHSGAAIERVFTVENTGTADLTTASLAVPTGFSISEGLSSMIAAGTSDTFTVALDTGSVGTKSGDISFVNNDSNEGIFTFAVTGVVSSPPPPPPPPPPPAAPVIGLFTVDDTTPQEGQGITASWTVTNGQTAWSIDSDGDGDADYTGTTETTQVMSYASAATVTPTLTVTNASGSDTEAGPTIVVSVAGSETLISKVTIENAEDTDKTSEIVEFGFPTHGSHLTSGAHLKVYDDDGSGGKGTLLSNYQIDNICTDQEGDQRFAKLTAIVPALGRSSGGSKLRKLHIYESSDAAPTGTAIALSDVQALAGYANGLVKVSLDIGGTVYTISVKDIIDSGSTTFSKTGLWRCSQLWRTGPLCTEWIMRAAPQNGGSPHASGDGMHIRFHVAAYKAGSGAVDGGNPITGIRVDVLPENGDQARALTDIRAYGYGLLIERATSISDATLVSTDQAHYPLGTHRFSYPRTSPSAGITVSATSVGAGRTITRDSGSWDADILGGYIRIPGNNGWFLVTARTSGTVVTGEVFEAFSSTTYTSGNWVQEGVRHNYNSHYFRRSWIGNRPTHQWAYGDNTSAVTPTTKAHHDFLASSEMIFEYGQTFAGTTHTMTNLDARKAPDGTIRPISAPSLIFLTYYGDTNQGFSNTGAAGQIGWLQDYFVDGIVKYDSNGKRKVWENAEHFMTYSWMYPAKLSGTRSTGANPQPVRADDGLTLRWDSGLAYAQQLYQDPTTYKLQWQRELGHHPSLLYLQYLMSGDYVWAEMVCRHADYVTWDHHLENSGSYGDGTFAVKGALGAANGISVWGDSSLATRGHSWGLRCLLQVAAVSPDNERNQLINTQTYYRGRLAQRWDAAQTWVNHASMIDPETGPMYDSKKTPNLTSLLRDGSGGADELYLCTPWTMGFLGGVAASAKYLGLTDANWVTFVTWLKRFWVEQVDNPDIVFDLWSSAFQHIWADKITPGMTDADIPVSTGEMYRRTCLLGSTNQNGWGFFRVPSGTKTISDRTVGTGRTMTFANPYFVSGGTGTGAWYVDGYISHWAGGQLRVVSETTPFQVGEIVSVKNGATTEATFEVLEVISVGGSESFYRISNVVGVTFYFQIGRTLEGNLGGAGSAGANPSGGSWNPIICGVARITNVVSSTEVVVTVLQEFAETTLRGGAVIPGPHPDDYDGSASASNNGAQDAHFMFGCRALKKVFGSTMDPPIAAMAAKTGFSDSITEKQFWIVGRT